MSTTYERHANVAVIKLANPPVNSLNHRTRSGILHGVERANEDPRIEAILLIGAGSGFSGGADIKEFDRPEVLAEPTVHTVIQCLEASSKPVVAAVHGVAMGGGLELALGAHHRVFAPGTQLALPEVKLGLVPGAGGTQRLPRAIGVEKALQMIVAGNPEDSEVLAARPGQRLVDRLARSTERLEEEAIAFAREVAQREARDARLPLVRSLPCSHPFGDGFFQFVRNTLQAGAHKFPAPLQCVDLVEAATQLAFDAGLAREQKVFMDLMSTPQSRSLRHIFLATRSASKIADVPSDTPLRSIASVAVIGAGTMGGGIAMNFLNAGMPVRILETKAEAMERGLATIRRNYEAQVKKGKLTQDDCEQRMALLSPTLSYQDIRDADLVIEAVFEEMVVKQAVFEALDGVMKDGAILASNTSTLNLDRIAAFTRRPQDVVGLHFFSPANVMKLLEVVRGEKTAKDVLATVMALAKTIRKTAVVSGVTDGFIGNRMIERYSQQAGFLLDEGATPEQVDKAIERFGFAMGPFRMGDLAGNDIGWAIRKRRAVENPDFRFSKTADLLCEMGRFGQKTGAGWYDYLPGKRDAIPSRQVTDMIGKHRLEIGVEPRAITDEEIVQRLVYALVNEGARILEEGIAARAGDIDVVYQTGYGFPSWRGGPMHYAKEVGYLNVARAMRRFQKNPLDDARFWEPAPLIQRWADGAPMT